MQFGYFLLCTVLAALSYTLATMQTAAHYKRQVVRCKVLVAQDQLALPLTNRDGPMVLRHDR